MAFTEDLSAFFNADEHAGTAQLNGIDVIGIFENAYVASNGGVGMAGSEPIFTLPTVSVPAGPVGLSFVHDGVTYRVAEHQPDGTGVSTLYLEKT